MKCLGMESKTKKVEKIEKEGNSVPKDSSQKRTGLTVITSVSVSREFSDIIKKFDLSPTEVFRKGLGVTLHDLGVPRYQSNTNHERSVYVKEFLKRLRGDELIKEISEKIIYIGRTFEELNRLANEEII